MNVPESGFPSDLKTGGKAMCALERFFVWPALFVALGCILLQALPARAVQLDQEGCQTMAIWGRDLVWARDMGADRAKVRAYVDKQRKESPFFVVLLPLFDQIWDTKASGEEVMISLFRDCVARRGGYGTDT
jgi:hypothetical protein